MPALMAFGLPNVSRYVNIFALMKVGPLRHEAGCANEAADLQTHPDQLTDTYPKGESNGR
jgi:hypothetical protein